MKIDPADFNALVAKAMQQAEVAAMRPVIEKELLHYDILYCLDQAGLLNELVFQGGTSLRLCHGGNRCMFRLNPNTHFGPIRSPISV